MEDRGVHPAAAAGGHRGIQGAHDQGGVVVIAHRPAHQVPGGKIEHAGQIQPALVGGDEGHIPAPGHIELVGVEQPAQQIRRRWDGGVRLGQAAPAAGTVTDDAGGGHQPLHPLVVHPPAASAQLMVDPRRPIGATRLAVDRADLGDQLSLGLLGRRLALLAPGGPGIEGRGRHPTARQAATTGNPAAFWASTQR
jgi:hypothetical protein